MQSLYEINRDLLILMESAYEQAETSGGEISDGLEMAITALEIKREEKIGNVARYIKNQLAEADMIKNEEKRLSERRKACENRAERLEAYLSTLMPGEAYKDANTVISWRKSESVMITGEIPDQYCKIEKKPILTEIKAALKSGVELNAVVQEKQNIQIK